MRRTDKNERREGIWARGRTFQENVTSSCENKYSIFQQLPNVGKEVEKYQLKVSAKIYIYLVSS